jgi:hypothetical protein
MRGGADWRPQGPPAPCSSATATASRSPRRCGHQMHLDFEMLMRLTVAGGCDFSMLTISSTRYRHPCVAQHPWPNGFHRPSSGERERDRRCIRAFATIGVHDLIFDAAASRCGNLVCPTERGDGPALGRSRFRRLMALNSSPPYLGMFSAIGGKPDASEAPRNRRK